MTLKILQANLNNNKAAHEVMSLTVSTKKISLCIITEPNKAISERKKSGNWVTTKNGSTAIWWTGKNRNLSITESGSTELTTWVKLTDNTTILGCYCPPNETVDQYRARLSQISDKIEEQGQRRILLAGDFNAKSEAWGSMANCPRGTKLLELLAQHNLTILNTGGKPTFERRDQESHIDITACGSDLVHRIEKWQVLEEESMSDHNYIYLTIKEDKAARKIQKRARINPRMLDMKIFVRQLRQSTENEGADAGMSQIIEHIQEASKSAESKIPPAVQEKPPVYWWNEELSEKRKTTSKVKRRLSRERTKIKEGKQDLTLMNELVAEQRQLKKEYRSLILKSKANAWKDLCDLVEMDPFGQPYKIVMNKIGAPSQPIEEEMIPRIISTLFPTQPALTPPNIRNTNDAIPEVTDEEIEFLCERSPRRKAPGPDGIPAELIKALLKTKPEAFKNLVNNCLRRGEFPPEGKIAALVLLPKTGKPPGDPSAYRPICLINTIAKAMESIINLRLTTELEELNKLSEKQYGFRKKRSTIAAINEVLHKAEEEQLKTKYTRNLLLLILLDVKNAFNSLNWGIINEALENKGISPYLRRTIGNYLSDRYITENGKRYEMTAGVPQGSVLGPTLWNVAYDSVLSLQLPEETETLAYADDLAIIVRSRTIEQLETRSNRALDRIARWMNNHKLALAPQKSEGIMLVGKKRTRDPNISLNGQKISIVNKAKYLGAILDKRLTFTKHIDYATGRARIAANNVARILPRTAHTSEQNRKLLAAVAESIAMYAAPVWATRAMKLKTNRMKLDAAQRPSTIRVARAHRTVSTEALTVLARQTPWTLLAKEREALYLNKTQHQGRSVEEIKAETLSKWQQRWENEHPTKGKWTKNLIPNLTPWMNRNHGDITYFTTQILSGHGKFQTYLKRIGKTDTEVCPYCDSEEPDDVTHTLYKCAALLPQRKIFTLKEGDAAEDALKREIDNMINSAQAWTEATKEIEAIMRRKSELEKSKTRETQRAQTEAGLTTTEPPQAEQA